MILVVVSRIPHRVNPAPVFSQLPGVSFRHSINLNKIPFNLQQYVLSSSDLLVWSDLIVAI